MKKSKERKEQKTRLKFKGRKNSKKGIASMLLALLSLVGFVVASAMSGYAKGAGGQILGIMGLASLLLALIGFVLGIRSFREPDILYFPPIFGSVVNGILLIVLVTLYLTGMLM